MNIDYEVKKMITDEGIYATIKTDINSITFFSSENDYKTNFNKYLNELIDEYKNLRKCASFKDNFLKGNLVDNLNMIKSAMKENIEVFFHYDLMGCFEIVSISEKTVKIIDICNNVKYLKHKYFNSLTKDGFSFSVYN